MVSHTRDKEQQGRRPSEPISYFDNADGLQHLVDKLHALICLLDHGSPYHTNTSRDLVLIISAQQPAANQQGSKLKTEKLLYVHTKICSHSFIDLKSLAGRS